MGCFYVDAEGNLMTSGNYFPLGNANAIVYFSKNKCLTF